MGDNDPLAAWQKMIGDMEKAFNALANQAMSSPEFSRSMNQASGLAAGSQKQLGEVIEKYLLAMNLPSRAQMVAVAERLQTIEGQLGDIKALLQQLKRSDAPREADSRVLRPPRTKRPPQPPSGDRI
jgi:hypothetical protein